MVLALALPVMGQDPRFTDRLAPYVSSPVRVVDRMLELAKIKPGETLYDLGCGDGRILIAAVEQYKVKAVGVEISPKLAAKAQESIARAGLQSQARVIPGDLLHVDFSGADVVAIYLSTQLNRELRPLLEKYLKPGARVVSHDYAIPGWKAAKVDRTGGSKSHVIYLYEIPATRN
ncbi:MAG TPA: class I SAM-dependent methyltransferase [Bryobacteraceae bacterium]|nr:class I SAM-dependent methyltransferase [Bryobacteraceae bacterium]